MSYCTTWRIRLLGCNKTLIYKYNVIYFPHLCLLVLHKQIIHSEIKSTKYIHSLSMWCSLNMFSIKAKNIKEGQGLHWGHRTCSERNFLSKLDSFVVNDLSFYVPFPSVTELISCDPAMAMRQRHVRKLQT